MTLPDTEWDDDPQPATAAPVDPAMLAAARQALRELQAEQLEDEAAAAGDALEAEASAAVEPRLYFEKLPDFVDQFLTKAYSRDIPAKATWCTQWWKHPEAVLRLSALWRAWEALRLEPGTGMSLWWRDHADPHMARLLDTNGPFKGCTRDQHQQNGKLEPLPWDTPPPELYDPLTYS
ncbi:DUF4913 domain-containing protein [Kribbella sp. NBC_00889]|uniref:DUF4913 domain-containing protein n=1 Tax=Kribbella sp. NBC_00889 TaxID=2975974 RepID=UPI00386DD825|nr:DUF4913 domain-containing protein [Kribbella sp. NBC_00889]